LCRFFWLKLGVQKSQRAAVLAAAITEVTAARHNSPNATNIEAVQFNLIPSFGGENGLLV
jgi:hypothetical protein